MTDVSHVIADSTVPPPPPPETDDEEQAFQPDLIRKKGDEPFEIPTISEAYQAARDLDALAQDLLKRDGQVIDDLRWTLQGARVRYLWRQKGGTRRGAPNLSGISRLGGLTKHFGRADFTIWVAVDHAKDLEPTFDQMRGLLLHELLKIEKRITDDDEESHHLRNPTIEAFPEEIQLFGLWRDELRVAAEAFQQVGLFDVESTDDQPT